MKETRHPHPHIDPRQPRDNARPGTNPPVFAWKPADGESGFCLMVARDALFGEICLNVEGLSDPLYLPEKAFGPGRYFWKWTQDDGESDVFSFEIAPDAVAVETPSVDEWLRRLPGGHPRIYLRPEDVPGLRTAKEAAFPELTRALLESAGEALAEPHEMAEPEFLPDRNQDYGAFWKVWYPTMWGSRAFVKGAETLGLAYLVTGNEAYARAACRRLASVSTWDPEGSSFLGHNDEAHMSVVWHGSNACDWVWDRFTGEERAKVIAQYRRRGQITFDHMHNRGSYGVTRFDSHAGREIVFLAHLAMVFHEEIPEARGWLDWLRPVLCGVWPIWAGDDGAWAEGPSYGLAYVTIMTMFCTALKRGTGVDLYRRPFWKGHARWRQYCFPPYAEWMGFGDHSERWASTWRANADLVDLIGRETGTGAFSDYVSAFRREAETCETPAERRMPGIVSQLYMAPADDGESAVPEEKKLLRVFPAAGWAALRTHLSDPERDVAMIFRSSPYGAVSHSHANNNDFILHVGGRAMAMPSGYYSGYGSDHHAHWVWHTKSHNCVTLSDAPQVMRSHNSRGAVEQAFEDDRLVYFRGNADSSYADRAARCRRHVIFLKPHGCFVMVDEFAALPHVASALQWNIHSWNSFAVDEDTRRFSLVRGDSTLEGHLMYHHNAFFSLTEGWDPPPMKGKESAQWRQQYHLRFTPSGLVPRRNLGVVLCAGHASLKPAAVQTKRSGSAEVAHIGEDLALVNQGREMAFEGVRTDALVFVRVQGVAYEVRDEGILHVGEMQNAK